MKRCKDASSIKQQRLFKRRWRRWGHKAISIIAILSVSLCQCVPQQTRQAGNSTGMFNLQDYSFYYDTTGGQRDYSTGLGQFAEYTQESHHENKPAAPQNDNRDYQYWSSDHSDITEGRIMTRGNKTYNRNTWQQGPTGQPSSDHTPAPKWSQVDHTDHLSNARQQALPPQKNDGNNANYEGPHFWYEDRWNQSYQYDQVTQAPKVYDYPEENANYHHNVSSYQQQSPVEQSWNYNGYFQGNAENSMQNPQNVWEQTEGQFEDNKNEIDEVFAQHIATIYEEDIPSGHNNNPGQEQDLRQQYSQQHNQDEHFRQPQLKKHQAQQMYQHQIRPQGQKQQQYNNQQWVQTQLNHPENKQQPIREQQNQQQDNKQWAQMQLKQPENKQQFIQEQQNQQQDSQKKIQLLQAQQNQQQKWLKQQQKLGMGPQSQKQQLWMNQKNQQQQLGMDPKNQQQQLGMDPADQQQQLGMDPKNQQQQLGIWHQSQQQQLGMWHQSQQQQQLAMGHQSQQQQQLVKGQQNQEQQQLVKGQQNQQQNFVEDQESQQQQLEKDEQAKKDQLIQQILSHHYQKSREEMPQKPTVNDAKLNGRPKPNSFIRFPVKQPSKIWRWQMAIRNRFQNHIDKSRRRKESEERGIQPAPQPSPETYGTSIVDSFAESAVMPGAFLAFCMLFMDILNRLMPFSFTSTPTTTTTTTRPPKIVQYEWTPPKIPTVVDMLEHMSDKFARLKAFKLKKKSKKKKWMASSEEDKWRGLPFEGKSKRKRKKGGKRTTKAPKLSLERLQDLYQIYKPEYIKNNQLSYLL